MDRPPPIPRAGRPPKGPPLTPLQKELLKILAEEAARELLGERADPAQTPPHVVVGKGKT
jgi:hypothetical protein